MADSRRNDQWYRTQHGGTQVTITRLIEENRMFRAENADLKAENTLLRSQLAEHGITRWQAPTLDDARN